VSLETPYTPAIVVDQNILDANIYSMAAFAEENNLVLRPHAKTHKIGHIAHKQLAAGSPGLSVATVGEAEYFFNQGISDLFISYPLWVDPHSGKVLTRLATEGTLAIGTDSVTAVHRLADVTAQHPDIIIMIEINSGHNRSGVSAHQVVPIAEAVRKRHMTLGGVFTFPGHSYGPGEQNVAAEAEAKTLKSAEDYLREAGFEVSVLSGGSSPSAKATVAGGATEIRPGVYVFGDAQQYELGRVGMEEISLTIVTTVVSRDEGSEDTPARIIVDAGSKVLAADRAHWATGHGRVPGHPEARITGLSEHHGTIFWDSADLPEIGSRLHIIPNHVCVAVNLVDEIFVSDGQKVIDRWQVGARGMNS